MKSTGTLLKIILCALVFLCLSGRSYTQITSKDTADYLPEYFEGALDYNLMVAASKGLDTEIERLILRGADVEAETQEGATALIIAISSLKPYAVNTLLIYNSDPNKETGNSETPLLVTLKKLVSLEAREQSVLNDFLQDECLQIAESLIRYGADIDYQDNHGVTALNYASIYGSFRFADLLLYYLADIDKKADDGTTPLMSAIWAGHANVADLLVQNGANLEARDKNGFTPFLIAAQNGDTLILNYLIKKGVDIYEKDYYGWNALGLSIKHNHIDAVSLLINSGDRWNDSGRDGINYYNVAVKFGRNEIFRLLEEKNFPEKYFPRINQLEISVSSKFNPQDIYTGMRFIFREPRKRFGILAGFDTKLWYTWVIMKESELLYYQYRDKSSIAYAGIFKEIPLKINPLKSNWLVSGSLSGGYFFANRFKGTETMPESNIKIIPAVTLKWQRRNFSIYGGLEYTGTDFYKTWPVWCRAGVSYNFDFVYGKTPVKTIKWY